MAKTKTVGIGVNKTKPAADEGIGGPFYEGLKLFSASFLPRTNDIVRARFGLSGSKPKTLEEIGKTYGITRERVRQILAGAFASVKQRRDDASFVALSEIIEKAVRDHSGIISVSELFSVLAGDSKREAGSLSFFLECVKSVKEERETKDRVRAYAVAGFPFTEWDAVHAIALKAVRSSDNAFTEEALFAKAKNGLSIDRKTFFGYLAVSSEIRRNPFGRWGVAESNEITPRGTREKAYLVLKMNGFPMHFKEIAKRIDESGLQKRGRATHPQTVHNELIKDKKFVLVGRGLYALSEWGFEKGTVREVIEDVIRKHPTPMTREEIIDAVLSVRTVKRSTIVINLNSFFGKVGKDRYTVK
ncbi:MAG TPA: HTH domain-containing protein [Candidatus Fimivivens sp.]|nr:HTH domain-containing protein [Candidatus Fimivivens sp.]